MKRAACLLCVIAAAAGAQQPLMVNAKLETKALQGTLEAAVRGAGGGPAWIGYAVPIVPGDRQICGSDSRRRLSLEGPTTLFVLYRVEQGAVGRIRSATPDCEIDAGGLPVTWLTGVDPAASVRYLATFSGLDKIGDSAVSAIAFHKDPAADSALEGLLGGSQPDKVREKAIMWLSVARKRYDRVIQAAHDDKSPHVRGQALFWLAQGAQRKVAGDAIANAIANDPETEVKKKAVFALTQMPDGEGVARLIDVARTNRNAAVRKQAVFWLGQSKDPRALDFLEQILTR
jgi:hypothetical protein